MNDKDILETLQAINNSRNSKVYVESDHTYQFEDYQSVFINNEMKVKFEMITDWLFEVWPISSLLTKPLTDNLYFFSTN